MDSRTNRNQNNVITETMRKALRAEFPKEAYSQHPTKTFLTTLKAMYVLERLNDVFGIGRWTINFEIIERAPDYVLGQGEFVSLDYEVTIPKQFGGHNTTGKNTEIADGYKSALTDCQSKIASYLEIGIDMFKGKIIMPGKKKYTPAPQNTAKAQVSQKDIKKSIPQNTGQKTDISKELPWLNKMKGKDFTPEYLNILNGITDGKIKSLEDIKKFYKFRTSLAEEIQQVINSSLTQ